MKVDEIGFDVADDVLALGLNVACFVMSGVKNAESADKFERVRQQEIERVASAFSLEALKEDPLLQGFRTLHERAGCSNRKNTSASENLLKMVLKHRSFPHVNLLVDIYNLVSVSTRLSLGAHDVGKISGNVHLRRTSGQERFVPIGSPELAPVKPGEYAYIDDDNDVLCRLEVRQVEKTKVTLDTTDCLFILQGNPATSPDYIKAATEQLIDLTRRFCGGQERILYQP
jgi:DNA/RNA-binding domain of Phe-tRNA-synthetase-like protein